MNNEIIKLSKISKKFVGNNKDISVLKNINLKISKGELVSLYSYFKALIGSNFAADRDGKIVARKVINNENKEIIKI